MSQLANRITKMEAERTPGIRPFTFVVLHGDERDTEARKKLAIPAQYQFIMHLHGCGGLRGRDPDDAPGPHD